jgi:hypothetical protein
MTRNLSENYKSLQREGLRTSLSVLFGIFGTMLGAFPAAALTALVYRFPIPFAGIESGPDAMVRAFMAVVFYGLLGGFPFLAVVGGIGGFIISGLSIERKWSKLKAYTVLAVCCLAIDFAACIGIASLDLIIGPW